MIKALAIKELRESLGITVVAALVMAILFWNQISILSSSQDVGIPFVRDLFSSLSVAIAGGMAGYLGLKQTITESTSGTFSYLYSRPISRRRIILTKLSVGSLLVLSLITLSNLSYGVWAATPGNWAGPFQWSMTFDAWVWAGSLPLLYLGSFLSGIRPGRWFGTRLVPLAGAAVIVAIVVASPVWWFQVPVLAIAYVGWWLAIDYCSSVRDY